MKRANEVELTAPPSRRVVLLLLLSALAAALVILLVAVLPAEYNRDPTQLGRLTGIASLWAPEETIVPAAAGQAPLQHSYATPFRSDRLEIPLGNSDLQNGDEAIEYKVRMAKGSTLIYSWEAVGVPDAEEFYTEFHGHTVATGKSVTVAYYRKAAGAADHGALIAPFDGVHGWYFQNQSAKPVTLRLRISGFYTLIPDGRAGNESGLHATPVD